MLKFILTHFSCVSKKGKMKHSVYKVIFEIQISDSIDLHQMKEDENAINLQ